jgi:hypothetical protein
MERKLKPASPWFPWLYNQGLEREVRVCSDTKRNPSSAQEMNVSFLFVKQ